MGSSALSMATDDVISDKCRETRRRRIEMRRTAARRGSSGGGAVGGEKKAECGSIDGDAKRGRFEAAGAGEDAAGDCSAGSSSSSSPGLEAAGGAVSAPPVYGVVSMSGRAREMEDAVTARTEFFRLGSDSLHFFAVYDGHGGPHVALLCRERMHIYLGEELSRAAAESPGEGGDCSIPEAGWREATARCFERMDVEALGASACGRIGGHCECERSAAEIVGSTAVVAVLADDVIVVSNCGDSRAVLSRGGRAVPLSTDHKPDRPDELARIEDAGGRVIYLNGARVQGILAMSRAIGDKYLKPFVISEPEVNVIVRTREDEFMILASDGLWDVISNDLACDVARRCLNEGNSCPGDSAEDMGNNIGGTMHPNRTGHGNARRFTWCSLAAALLTNLALGRRSSDNISVIVVDLKRRSGSGSVQGV